MDTERTEEQKLARAPIIVTLGGQERDILPLVIRDSRPWRKKIIGLLAALPRKVTASDDDPDAFEAAFNTIASDMPDEVIDLFFEYAKDLNRTEIEAVATEDEMAKAFQLIIEVAFPLAASLPAVLGRLSASAESSSSS